MRVFCPTAVPRSAERVLLMIPENCSDPRVFLPYATLRICCGSLQLGSGFTAPLAIPRHLAPCERGGGRLVDVGDVSLRQAPGSSRCAPPRVALVNFVLISPALRDSDDFKARYADHREAMVPTAPISIPPLRCSASSATASKTGRRTENVRSNYPSNAPRGNRMDRDARPVHRNGKRRFAQGD